MVINFVRCLLIVYLIVYVSAFNINNLSRNRRELKMDLLGNLFGKKNKLPDIPENGYDYIVVGGGTAGCVLANRLTTDPNNNVLMIEAGSNRFRHKLIEIPAGILRLFKNPTFDWDYETKASSDTNNRGVYLCRGKVLGGSSCTNVLLYHRGNDNDYKHWAEVSGEDSWGPNDVLPYFKKSQDDFRGESLYHSKGGEFAVSEVRYQNPLSKKFLQACGELGYPANDDFNNWSRSQEGYGRYQVTERDGARCSTATGFLDPVKKRSNLHVITETMANKLIFDENKKVIGVDIDHNGENKIINVSSNGEVLLAGGAINSPQLLMLSGIGPKEHLQEHKIPVVVDRPGVGKNLQDHPAAVVSYAVKPEYQGISVTSKIRIKGTKLSNPKVLLQWFLKKSGPLTSTGCDHGGFFKSNPQMEDPDIQLRFLSAQALSADGMSTFTEYKKSAGHPDGFSLQSIACRAHSRGHIKLASSDPQSKPIIEGCHLSDERDVYTLREGIKLSRKLAEAPALSQYKAEEVYPGKHINTDSEIDNYIRNTVHTSNALVGTCRMGRKDDPHAVVDGELKVLGVSGLRVIDASVMPKIPGGQTSAPTVMIAEKAADILMNA